MKMLTIPDTDLSLFPIGLGAVLAGLSWDARETGRIFDTYLDGGGNLIDTAHVYSDWVKPETARSERMIGDWLASSHKRERIILMTKGGHPDMTVAHPDMHHHRMTGAEMQKDLDSSLMKLRTGYIDIYFYHRDDPGQTVAELIEVMQNFVRAGKIRYYGCSNWDTARMREADLYCREKGYRGFIANQAMFNLASRYMKPPADDTLRAADDTMQDYHRERPENLLMPYMGLCGGYFHRLLERGPEAVTTDSYNSEENQKIALRVRALVERYQVSVSQVLLAYFWGQEFPCVPLFGPRNAGQLSDAMKGVELPEEIWRD